MGTSSGRTSPKEAEEEEKRCATAATVLAILPESAPTRMRATAGAEVVAEGARATLCATAVTGLVTLPENAPRVTAEATWEDLFATDVTELDTLLGSALRAMAAVMLGAVVDMEVGVIMVSVAVATDTEVLTILQNLADLAAVVATSATGVVDPSATSATGLVTLPASAGRKKIGATSATAPATSRGTAARTRTPATTATRWAIL